MSPFGIYTLANDAVYDQLVALLNSIEVNVSNDIPICVIPYNQQIDRIKQEINHRENVTLFDNVASIERWESFAHAVWKHHPDAKKAKLFHNWWTTGNLQRKMCVFDGKFEKFVFYDADSLAMKPLDQICDRLDSYDFIFDDWIHTKERDKIPLNLPLLERLNLFNEHQIRPRIHCSDFFAAKGGLFNEEELAKYQELLIANREVEWLTAWWDDAHLFNYLTFKSNRPLFNYTLSSNGQDRTGNCALADPFVNINNVMYNAEGLKPIHRLHYMNYPAIDFTRLSQGENVGVRYQDVFLHYRFLKNPEQRPESLKYPSTWVKGQRLYQKAVKKIQRVFSENA